MIGELLTQPQQPQILLTYDQAARALSISKSKLYTLVNLGEVLIVAVGKKGTRFRPTDLQAYVDKHVQTKKRG